MIIKAYTVFPCTLVITAATPRPDMAASSKFVAAGVHEDYCADVRRVMAEHCHISPTDLFYPAARRLQNWFPTHPAVSGRPLYKVLSVQPAGSPRDIDQEFKLEVMRIRYELVIQKLNAAFLADEAISQAMERHIEYATKMLFEANNVAPAVFIHGEQTERPGDRTEVDIICEQGPGAERTDVEIPTPTAS